MRFAARFASSYPIRHLPHHRPSPSRCRHYTVYNMASDVEMQDVGQKASSSAVASRHSSLAAIINPDQHEGNDNSGDEADHPNDHDHDGNISIKNNTASSPRLPTTVPILFNNSISPCPLSPTNPAVTPAAKPKSFKPKPRSPSPSPPPAPPPPPLQTVRLEIFLGGPSNYEVNIARQAKETGQRPPTPTPIDIKKTESSESEEEDKPKDGTKPKSKKKKKITQEEYDTSDPFIDDSELAVDQRKWFGQTKQQGFYVSSGEVALVKDKTPKKPKSKKPSLATALNPPTAEGIRETSVPTNFSDTEDLHLKKEPPADEAVEAGDERAGQKRKRYITVVEGGKKRKIVNIQSFHPDLQLGIENIKQAIAQESWAQKGKFPPALKPQLAELALLAIKLDEYDDHFFNLMPTLFPYNKFTMTKLIKRTIYTDHVALLVERQEILLKELAELARVGFPKAEEEWERSVVAWDRRQEKIRAEAAEAANGTAVGTSAGTTSAGPTRHPTEEMDVDQHHPAVGSTGADGDGEGGKDGKDHGQHPPAKRFRMTETMKNIVWNLVLLSNECCRLENEKNTYEGSMIQVSEQGLRKVLYQKIVAAFPEGWMSSGQISRDVSVMKKKYEKENMENEA